MSKKLKAIVFVISLIILCSWLALHILFGGFTSIAKSKNGEIEFYGKVINQYGEPVKNARLGIYITAFNESKLLMLAKGLSGGFYEVFTNNKRFYVITDEQGLFAIENKRGDSISVDSFQHYGYWPKIDNRSFNSSVWSNAHKADINNPVVYEVWQLSKTEPLIKTRIWKKVEKNIREELTPIQEWRKQQGLSVEHRVENDIEKKDVFGVQHLVHLFNKEKSPWYDKHGAFYIAFEITGKNYFEGTRRPIKKEFDWLATIETIDGGIQFTEDKYPFLAPETGYKPVIRFEYKAEQTDWTRRLTRRIYFKQGKNYGTCDLEISVSSSYYYKNGIFHCSNVLVNPNGSKNLQPNQAELY